MTGMPAFGIPVRHFCLADTFQSAQPLTFYARYDQDSGTLAYAEDRRALTVRFTGSRETGRLIVECDDVRFARDAVANRFRLTDDMEHVYERIGTDDFMRRAIRRYDGMRLTLNDPWETTLCFIISQFNNVKRIRGIVRRIVERFGEPVNGGGDASSMRFPSSADMMRATVKDLMVCGAGFRSKYIASAADYCTNNLDLYKLVGKPYDELKEQLMTIDGVGDKVADCIALMGYGCLEAFPIDVWVKRTIERVYFRGRKITIRRLHDFAEERWGGMRGYAQQYLFWAGMHYGR